MLIGDKQAAPLQIRKITGLPLSRVMPIGALDDKG